MKQEKILLFLCSIFIQCWIGKSIDCPACQIYETCNKSSGICTCPTGLNGTKCDENNMQSICADNNFEYTSNVPFSCWLIDNDKRTFDQSIEFCRLKAVGTLLTRIGYIPNQKVQDSFDGYKGKVQSRETWIGLKALNGSPSRENNRYSWTADGINGYAPMTFSPSSTVLSDDDQLCIRAKGEFNAWSDMHCSSSYSVLCEIFTSPPCSKLNVMNGEITYNESAFDMILPFYTKATLTCNDGYTLKDARRNAAVCNKMVGWRNDSVTTCVACQKTDQPKGKMTYSKTNTNDDTVPDGETGKLHCNDGYALQDPNKDTVRCNKDIWDGSFSSCVGCNKDLPTVMNGVIEYDSENTDGTVQQGETAVLECNNGYELFENKYTKNCDHGNWIGEYSTCVACEKDIASVSHGAIHYIPLNDDGTVQQGGTASVECHVGYHSRNGNKTCTRGSWQGNDFSDCVACSKLVEPITYGKYEYSAENPDQTIPHDATAKLTCDPEYVPFDVNLISNSCNLDTWVGEPITSCVAGPCKQQQPCQNNGICVDVNGTNYECICTNNAETEFYGEVCENACLKEFTDWSQCSQNCGYGTRHREKNLVENGDCVHRYEHEVCNKDQCQVCHSSSYDDHYNLCADKGGLFLHSACYFVEDTTGQTTKWDQIFQVCEEAGGKIGHIYDTDNTLESVVGWLLSQYYEHKIALAMKADYDLTDGSGFAYWMANATISSSLFMHDINTRDNKSVCFALTASNFSENEEAEKLLQLPCNSTMFAHVLCMYDTPIAKFKIFRGKRLLNTTEGAESEMIMGVPSPRQCGLKCRKKPDCLAFNYNLSQNKCELQKMKIGIPEEIVSNGVTKSLYVVINDENWALFNRV